MIRAIIFDLDGVLVQTEKLKALSYARAVQRIRGLAEPDFWASEAYREVLGTPRETASKYVMNKLGMEHELIPLMARYGVSKPEEVLTAVRYEIYDDMVADPKVIRNHQCPEAVEVLRIVKKFFYMTALATLSKRQNVQHVIYALGIGHLLDVIITAEDVSIGKPDPAIYLLTAQKFGFPPGDCLVLEDSVNGVKSALAAGMNAVAIATLFTKDSILSSGIIEDKWIVQEPEKIVEIVWRCLKEHNRQGC